MNAGKVQSVRGRRQRGASPMVGIVLLFVLVMIGATLVFVVGSAMFDALQSEATNERTQQAMLETDHRITTVATTGYDQPLPTDELQGAQVSNDGSISVAWYNNGTKSNPWADSSCTVSGDLGALEIEQGGNTIAHQGGGIWERSGGETSVVSEPSIGYDGESVQLQILQLKEGDFGGSDPIARANHSAATELTDRINEVGTQCPNPHVAVRIDSSYHDGWSRVMEDALGEDEYSEVDVEHDETAGTVEATITGVRDPIDKPTFVVADDRGLVGVGKGGGTSTLAHANRVPYADGGSPPFSVDATIENTENAVHSERVNVSIWDEGQNTKLLSESEVIQIDGNQTKALDEVRPKSAFNFESKEYGSVLEAGETYTYVIETESGDKTDDPPGTFYFGKDATSFDASSGNAAINGSEVTISSELQNVGVESGSQNVTLELDYQDDLPDGLADPYGELGGKQIHRSYGESAPAEFTLNGSKLIDGEYEATIRPEDGTSETVTFDVTAGIDAGRVGLGNVEDANVTVDILGSQVSGSTGRYRHQLSPLTLDVVTNGETEHSFTNPNGGTNINTGPTWQNKHDDSYSYEFTADEKTDLTLRNTRYATYTSTGWGIPRPVCDDRMTNPSTLPPDYTGPKNKYLVWCSDVPSEAAFGPIDASENQNLQNVRVRSAENNTIPALPAGAPQQQSATEILQERNLIKDDDADKLDLDEGEFVFLFENTEDCKNSNCNEDDIDALWDDAVDAYETSPTQTHDPDFNDLIVYVEVERAGVDPGKPGITIQPGSGDSTDVGSGNSDSSEGATERDNTGVNVDTSNIVIG
ncbi:DUF7289 family protein [Natrinema thermotolerans]